MPNLNTRITRILYVHISLRFLFWPFMLLEWSGYFSEQLIIIIKCILRFNMLYYTYHYYFKLFNLFRQQQAYSRENFCKPRGPQHTNYYIVVIIVAGKNMQWTRNEVHRRITETRSDARSHILWRTEESLRISFIPYLKHHIILKTRQ